MELMQFGSLKILMLQQMQTEGEVKQAIYGTHAFVHANACSTVCMPWMFASTQFSWLTKRAKIPSNSMT